MHAKNGWAALVLVGCGCATAAPQVTGSERPEAAPGAEPRKGEGRGGAAEESGPFWTPGPGGPAALAALWAAKPFALPAAQLAVASGGPSPRYADEEVLLDERTVQYDAKGLATETSRNVYRQLRNDEEHGTLQIPWAPWREERPELKIRIVSPEGAERWFDSATIVEAAASSEATHLSDERLLRCALPGAGSGTIVEFQIVRREKAVSPGGNSSSWVVWTRDPIRRSRLTLSYPEPVKLQVKTVGIGPLAARDAGGQHQLLLDLAPPEFNPFLHSKREADQLWPRVEWTTAASWGAVAQAYAGWVAEARANGFDAAELLQQAAGAKTRLEKAQAAMSWLRGKVRYTALQLGDGALRPTSPATVLARGYGDCKDLAVALSVALEKLGVAARPAVIEAGERDPLPEVPGLGGFNHMIVYLPAANGEGPLWIDATDADQPVSQLDGELLGRRALIIDPATTALTDTPAPASQANRISEAYELTLAGFDDAQGRYELTAAGVAEGDFRTSFQKRSAEELEKLAGKFTGNVFGESKLLVARKNVKAGQGPYGMVVTAAKVARVSTGDMRVEAVLPLMPMGRWVDDDILGVDPEDQGDSSAREKADREAREQTGLSAEQLSLRPERLDARMVLERSYLVRPPPGFVLAGQLPEGRTLELGPAHYVSAFKLRPDGAVEATAHFDSQVTELDGPALTAFREAYWRMAHEPMTKLTFVFGPRELLSEARPAEAMAQLRKLIAGSPKDGLLHARSAKLLLDLHLARQARAELDQALALAPNEPLSKMIEASIDMHGSDGERFSAGFQRGPAIAALRAAIAAVPEHSWPRARLAEVLERDEHGESLRRWNPQLAESARLYMTLLDEGSSDELRGQLMELWGRSRQYQSLLDWQEKHADARSSEYSLAAQLVLRGPDPLVRALRGLRNNDTQRASLVTTAFGALGVLREYDALRTTVHAVEREFPGGTSTQFDELFGRVKATPALDEGSTPESMTRSLLSRLANAETPGEAGRIFAQHASASGKAELDGSADSLHPLGSLVVDVPGFAADMLIAQGTCETAGNDSAGYRVRCTGNFGRQVQVSFFWVREGRALKLATLGPGIEREAWAAAKRKPEDAALWFSWWIEDEGSAAPPLALELLRALMQHPGEPVFTKAAGGLLLLTDDYRSPAEALDALDAGRQRLDGHDRKVADRALATFLMRRDEPARALTLLVPLADSTQEDDLLQFAVTGLLEAKKYDEARARIAAGLKRAPGSRDWVQLQAELDKREGRYDAALAGIEGLLAHEETIGLLNEVLWLQILAGKFDDRTETRMNQLARQKSLSLATTHTLAAVMIERGHVDEAADLLQNLVQRKRHHEWTEDCWMLRAEILAALGFPADAKEAWSHVVHDADLVLLRDRALRLASAK